MSASIGTISYLMKIVLTLLALMIGGSAMAQTSVSGPERPQMASQSLLLPSESRGLPMVQRVGRFHSGVILCKIVPSTEAATLRADAKARLPAGDSGQFDREYNIGSQEGVIAWQGMSTIRRVSYCRQINDTWQATQNQPPRRRGIQTT